MNELQSKIVDIFYDSPDMIFGFTDISYSDFGKEYKSGLVFAVPYTHQLTLENYNEKVFPEGILGAKDRLEVKVKEIETVLKKDCIPYYVPQVAQKDDGEHVDYVWPSVHMDVKRKLYACYDAGLEPVCF